MIEATTSYGSWGTYRNQPTLDAEVHAALGDQADEFDTDAIADEYRRAINDALPEGVELHGDELYGPCDQAGQWTVWFGAHEFEQAVDVDVDFWEIAARHERDLVEAECGCSDPYCQV